MTRHTSFLFRLTSRFVAFSVKSHSTPLTRSLLSRIHPLFHSSAHSACLTTPHPSITPSPFPPITPTTFPDFLPIQRQSSPSPLHLVIIRPFSCLVPALAHPLPCACHRLLSKPLLYPLGPAVWRRVTPFGSTIPRRSAARLTNPSHPTTYCGVNCPGKRVALPRFPVRTGMFASLPPTCVYGVRAYITHTFYSIRSTRDQPKERINWKTPSL
jgi:hypothetical protein